MKKRIILLALVSALLSACAMGGRGEGQYDEQGATGGTSGYGSGSSMGTTGSGSTGGGMGGTSGGSGAGGSSTGSGM